MARQTIDQRIETEKAEFKNRLVHECADIRLHLDNLDKAWYGFEPKSIEDIARCQAAENLRSTLWDRYIKTMEILGGTPCKSLI